MLASCRSAWPRQSRSRRSVAFRALSLSPGGGTTDRAYVCRLNFGDDQLEPAPPPLPTRSTHAGGTCAATFTSTLTQHLHRSRSDDGAFQFRQRTVRRASPASGPSGPVSSGTPRHQKNPRTPDHARRAPRRLGHLPKRWEGRPTNVHRPAVQDAAARHYWQQLSDTARSAVLCGLHHTSSHAGQGSVHRPTSAPLPRSSPLPSFWAGVTPPRVACRIASVAGQPEGILATASPRWRRGIQSRVMSAGLASAVGFGDVGPWGCRQRVASRHMPRSRLRCGPHRRTSM